MRDNQSYTEHLPYLGRGEEHGAPLPGAVGPRLTDAEGDKPQPPSTGAQRATARFGTPQEKLFRSVQALSARRLADCPHPRTW